MLKFLSRIWGELQAKNRAGLKPDAVEEPIDTYWHRPLAGMIARGLSRTSVTPNQVTVASGLFGFLSGVTLALAIEEHPLFASVAGACLLFAAILDCADGQLARMKNMSSLMGRALDGIMDAVAPTAVFTAMVAFLIARGYPLLWVVAGGSFTAASLFWHALQYDAAKNVYLHCTEPNFSLGGNTLLSPDEMAAQRARLRADGRPAAALLVWIWQLWTQAQMKQIEPWLSPLQTPRDEAERALYESHVRPVMRVTTWLGFGFHESILALSMLLTPFFPEAIWVGWIVIVGPLNLVASYAALARPRRERLFTAQLGELRAATG